jgi:hypothetical protein
MSIQIFTSVVNRPDFVEIQDKLFKKFLKNDYQFHVIDDSISFEVAEQFKNICEKRNLKYYKKPKNNVNMNPAQACAAAIQWTYDNLIKENCKNNLVCFFDSDMFLIDYFDVEEYLSDSIISGLLQSRGSINYMWNGIMFFNMPKISQIDTEINFSDGYVEGQLTDVGGHTYYYFKKNNVIMKDTGAQYPTHYNNIELQNDEVTKGYNFELHLDGKFLHYRAATNWHSNWRGSEDPLEKKTKIFNKIIEELLLE